jgi:hypothetical protein
MIIFGILSFVLASTGDSFFPEPKFPPLRITRPTPDYTVCPQSPVAPFAPPSTSFCRVVNSFSSRTAAIMNCDLLLLLLSMLLLVMVLLPLVLPRLLLLLLLLVLLPPLLLLPLLSPSEGP